MLTFRTLALAAIVAVAAGNAITPETEPWYASGTPGFNYDCSDKDDGNYPHPTLCTHYVACVARSHAYEMSCALNHNGSPLHYVASSGPDPKTSHCDYPEVAGCDGPGTNGPTTTARSTTQDGGNGPTTRPPVTSQPPENEGCDRHECWVKGNCTTFQLCVNGTLTDHVCGKDLFFDRTKNPEYGGDCVAYENLDETVKNEYYHDDTCIPPCEWTQEQLCSPEYSFLEPFNNRTLSDRLTHDYVCGKDANGNQLVFNPATKVCDHRDNVADCNP